MPLVFDHPTLLRARLELGLGQEELAQAVGVDVRTYRRYESGEVNEGREGFSVKQPARKRLLARLCEELGLEEDELVKPAKARSVAPAPLEKAGLLPRHVHTLQRARHFVGREALLGELFAWATAPRAAPFVSAIVGVGGSGKTAVVERLLARLGDEPRPGGIFVWSFYDDERVEAFLAHALQYFGGVEAPMGERLERLLACLASGAPHLVVLDGLETVQAEGTRRALGEIEDPLLRRLLVAMARGLGAARALVTSRYRLEDLAPWAESGARTISIGPLSEGEATLLLRSWGTRGEGPALEEIVRPDGRACPVALGDRLVRRGLSRRQSRPARRRRSRVGRARRSARAQALPRARGVRARPARRRA